MLDAGTLCLLRVSYGCGCRAVTMGAAIVWTLPGFVDTQQRHGEEREEKMTLQLFLTTKIVNTVIESNYPVETVP